MSVIITNVLFVPMVGGYYNDDQAAIKAGASRDGLVYLGAPITFGFDAIRAPAVALGIGLKLSNGSIVWGDMMTVQYSGVSGRQLRFDPNDLATYLEERLTPHLLRRDVATFRTVVPEILSALPDSSICTPSVMYGLTQALLSAAASATGKTIAETICNEYELPLRTQEAAIFCQSGEDRYTHVDKMILKRADVLPHGLVNSPQLIGPKGEQFVEYAQWVRERVMHLGHTDYKPVLHFDVYGNIGDVFENDTQMIVEYLMRLHEVAQPLPLQIEAVADFGGRTQQIHGLGAIRLALREHDCPVKLVADEWCNDIDDISAFVKAGAVDMIQLKMPDIGSLDDVITGVQLCQQHGVGAYLGGSCAETDLSARISVHIAVATQADMQLAKPGMGVDEGYMVVANEQARLLATLRASKHVNKHEQVARLL